MRIYESFSSSPRAVISLPNCGGDSCLGTLTLPHNQSIRFLCMSLHLCMHVWYVYIFVTCFVAFLCV